MHDMTEDFHASSLMIAVECARASLSSLPRLKLAASVEITSTELLVLHKRHPISILRISGKCRSSSLSNGLYSTGT